MDEKLSSYNHNDIQVKMHPNWHFVGEAEEVLKGLGADIVDGQFDLTSLKLHLIENGYKNIDFLNLEFLKELAKNNGLDIIPE